jgi:hypothetical protein
MISTDKDLIAEVGLMEYSSPDKALSLRMTVGHFGNPEKLPRLCIEY